MLQAWIPDNLTADLSVPALAARACMSERSFARAFRTETGMTPAVYVESARAFRRGLGVSPGSYRERFRSAA